MAFTPPQRPTPARDWEALQGLSRRDPDRIVEADDLVAVEDVHFDHAETQAGAAHDQAVATASADATAKVAGVATAAAQTAAGLAATARDAAISAASSDASGKANAAQAAAVATAAADATSKANAAQTAAASDATSKANAAQSAAVSAASSDATSKANAAQSAAISAASSDATTKANNARSGAEATAQAALDAATALVAKGAQLGAATAGQQLAFNGTDWEPVADDIIDLAKPPYNLRPSTTDPGAVIQQGIDDANAAYVATGKPVILTMRPGTYVCDLKTIPNQTLVCAMIWRRSGVILRAEGVTLRLKDAATRPSGASNVHLVSTIYPFTQNSANVKRQMSITGLTIDGNAANQTAYNTGYTGPFGLFDGASRDCVYMRVHVKNVFGTASAPPGETFHFEANYSRDIQYIDCSADGSGSTNTASGFSADASVGITWNGCRAHDMGKGQGFTHWQCSQLRYIACLAFRNTSAAGFNSERSDGVSYTGCISGSTSNLIPSGEAQSVFFPSGQTRLGNLYGFTIQGSSSVALNGCVANFNGENFRTSSNHSTVEIRRDITGATTNSVTVADIPPMGSIAGAAQTLVGQVVRLDGGTSENLVVQSVTGTTITFTTNIANSGHTSAVWLMLQRPCDGVIATGCDFRFSTGGTGLGEYDVTTEGDKITLPIVSGGASGTATIGLNGLPPGALLSGSAQARAFDNTTVTQTVTANAAAGTFAVTLDALPAGTLIPRSSTTVFPSTVTLTGPNGTESLVVQSVSGTTINFLGTTPLTKANPTSASWQRSELVLVSSKNAANSTIALAGNLTLTHTLLEMQIAQYGVWVEALANNVFNGFTEAGNSSQLTNSSPSPVHSWQSANGVRFSATAAPTASAAYRWYTAAGLSLSLQGNGQLITTGRRRALVTKTANYTLTVADDIVIAITNSGTTFTLPSASSAGLGATHTLVNRTGGAVNLAPASGSIDGASGNTSIANGTRITVACDGSNWYSV